MNSSGRMSSFFPAISARIPALHLLARGLTPTPELHPTVTVWDHQIIGHVIHDLVETMVNSKRQEVP